MILNNTNKLIITTTWYGSVLLLILGTFFNVAVIGIFCRKELRQSKMAPYLICLAIVDLLIVWINYPQLIWHAANWENPSNGTFFLLHPIVGVIIRSLNIYSSWLIVVISLERLVAVYSPFSRLQNTYTCTPFIIMFFLFISVLITNISLNTLLKDHWLLLLYVVILYAFVPAVILITSSTLMIYKLLRRPNLGEQFQRISSTRTKNTIRLVIAINIIFLSTTFPVSICIVFLNTKKAVHQTDSDKINALRAVAYINNCVNFLCYMITSKVFRENLKQACFRKPAAVELRAIKLQD